MVIFVSFKITIVVISVCFSWVSWSQIFLL